MNQNAERAIAYVDGFNLYFGISIQHSHLKWLDVKGLAKSLLRSHQTMVDVKYFTSMVSNDPPKEQRQRTYLSAIQNTGTSIIYGSYRSRPKACRRCGHTWNQSEEKMTDVNIAVEMLVDAIKDRFDTAFLISGDSDLVPAIVAIQQNFPRKRVVVVFPPNRQNNSVKNVATGSLNLGRRSLSQNQFPPTITLPNGYLLHKPPQW